MTTEDSDYIEGVTDAMEAVSVALDSVRDAIDDLLANIATMDAEAMDEIARKCGLLDDKYDN